MGSSAVSTKCNGIFSSVWPSIVKVNFAYYEIRSGFAWGRGDEENKPLKYFNFKGIIRGPFSLTMTSTSLIGQPQWELKYKINTDQELLDLHLLCVCVYTCIYR